MKKLKLTSSIFILGIFLFGINSGVQAAHPALLIDATIKAELQQKVIDNTTEWQEMKSWCDSHLGQNMPRAYNFFGWAHAVQNYGACFVATGNQTYGNEGVIYLKALISDYETVGDGNGGSRSIQMDSGYVARTLGMSLALGRDWLDGATDLTPSVISSAVDVMDSWLTWYASSGYGRSTPHTNYYVGYFGMVYYASLGFIGDDARVNAWQTKANDMWTNEVLPLINTGYSKGGDWFEGWNYGNLSARIMLQYPHVVYTATGDTSKWNDTEYHHEVVAGQIQMLHPARDYVSDDGSWSGNDKGYPHYSTMMFLSAAAPLTSEEKESISWYINNIGGVEEPTVQLWEVLLWKGNLATPVVPTAATMGGLTYFFNGTGRVVTRSADWSDTQSTYVQFHAYSSEQAGHNERNMGEYKLASRGQQLIVDTDEEQTASFYGNVLMANGSHTYAPNQEWWHLQTDMKRVADGNDYVYSRAVNLENAYDGNNNNNPSLAFYEREMLFIRPDYTIIVDTVTPTNQGTNTITSQLHTMNEPAISGTSFSSVNGGAKLFTNLKGTAVNIAKVSTQAERTGSWKVSITPAATNSNYKLIHVFETADSSKATSDPVADLAGTGVSGITVGTTAVLFTASTTLADITTASYTVNATKHFVTGLPLNASVTVTRGGVAIPSSPINSGAGGVISFPSSAGSSDYAITAGNDEQVPTLAEITPVSTPTTNHTPNYTFSSTEPGTITYGGDCSSSTTSAINGNNTITLNTLVDGTYTNCTITVTDSSNNISTPLTISTFTITSAIRADVDQSGAINSTDALLTLRNSLGLIMSSTNWQTSSTTGDVNCSSNTNSTDALLILRNSLGLDMSGTGWCIS